MSTKQVKVRSFERWAEDFLEWMRIHNFSATTVKGRGYELGYFFTWARERGLVRPDEVTLQDLEQYQKYLYRYRKKDGNPLAYASQQNRLVAVVRYFRWLSKQKRIRSNPALELELPRKERRLPRNVLTAVEVEQVVNGIDTSGDLGLRDRTIIEVFYSTGIRRSELQHLTIADVDYERRTVLVRLGKWKKDRYVPIGERALKWLDKYLVQVRPGLIKEPDEGTVFLSYRGYPLSLDMLSEIVKRQVVAAGIEKEGSCHMLRHTMATLMLENGADIRFIQQILGHEQLTSTQVYTHVSIQQLRKVHEKTHPAKLRPVRGPAERKRLEETLADEADEE